MTHLFFSIICLSSFSQTPKSFSSSDILQDLEKLKVFGSVLYIAAHPDDENTRLLAYLANERKFRTGYLSITRGDGGQNLIGDEQGIELGLIRTQELLAARRVDGAEQFFTRAYDFGYSKSPDETLKYWGHDKILSDVVWVIRNFRPDVIITRFPTTGEGGHGHHTASAILASEAFDAAADATKFPEQLKAGIKPWQANRLFWNTFNFGGNNTTRNDQLKIDVGNYNPILGKSYGEIAAESRSQHKSQGFGVPAQRGETFEYFALIKGEKVEKDLMDGITTNIQRMELKPDDKISYEKKLNDIIAAYNPLKQQQTVKLLCELNEFLAEAMVDKKTGLVLNEYGKKQELNRLILKASGLFLEATVANKLNVVGDSLKYTVQLNNRLGIPINNVQVSILGNSEHFLETDVNKTNIQISKTGTVFIAKDKTATQPYWLEFPMEDGAFTVHNQSLIGMPELNTLTAFFQLRIHDQLITTSKPVFYKFTDPVKGELYEQPQFVNPAFVNVSPSLIIFSNNKKGQRRNLQFTVQPNIPFNERIGFEARYNGHSKLIFDSVSTFSKMEKRNFSMELNGDEFEKNSATKILGQLKAASLYEAQMFSLAKIAYNHIPDIYYSYLQRAKVIKM
ncbi:MAG TPA: PIG-L family deacetylase, partial [Ferruginibacter sp.]|nr:PIG-L family deacetylase [Ferruginibacter sp.]